MYYHLRKALQQLEKLIVDVAQLSYSKLHVLNPRFEWIITVSTTKAIFKLIKGEKQTVVNDSDVISVFTYLSRLHAAVDTMLCLV